jgi:hypothetical protein
MRGRKLTPSEIREGIDALFQKYDFSPVENLVLLCMGQPDKPLTTAQEIQINMFLTEFLIPKLKSVEVKGQVDHVHTIVMRRFGPDGPVDIPFARRVPGLPAPSAEAKVAVLTRTPVTIAVEAKVTRV